MRTGELRYDVRQPMPDALVRGLSCQLRAPVYNEQGALAAPTAGTVTVREPDGTVAATGSASIVDDVATFDVTIPTTQDIGNAGRQWRVEWSLTLSGETFEFRTQAEVVRVRLVCPVVPPDLYAISPQLSPSATTPLTTYTAADYRAFIREAWVKVLTRIRQGGRRPDLMTDAAAFREPCLHWALAGVYRSMMDHDAESFTELHTLHADAAERSFKAVRLTYAPDDDVNDREVRTGSSGFWGL